jgi:pimeloyl-ACP methyl ester carboxylesterase
VLTFDNRDIGHSGSGRLLPHMGVRRAFLRYLLRLPLRPAYTLDDMADDTLALADALGIGRFHVAGASMGGMIAQQLALAAPGRVLSLTSIMSSAGPRAAPPPKWDLTRLLLRAPNSHSNHRQRLDHYVALFTEIGRHHDPAEIARLREGLGPGAGARLPAGGNTAPVAGDLRPAGPQCAAAAHRYPDAADPRRARSAGAGGRRASPRVRDPARAPRHHRAHGTRPARLGDAAADRSDR